MPALTNALAAIVYNGSFNSTTHGPCSADKMAATVCKLSQDVINAAEDRLNTCPELFGDYVANCQSADPFLEAFVAELCEELGIT